MTIVRVRSADVDAKGNPVGTDDRLTLVGAFTAPRTSADVDQRGRNGVVVGLDLFAPHGTDVIRTDGIEVDGEPYRIVGEVTDWANPLSGWQPGVVAALERGAG